MKNETKQKSTTTNVLRSRFFFYVTSMITNRQRKNNLRSISSLVFTQAWSCTFGMLSVDYNQQGYLYNTLLAFFFVHLYTLFFACRGFCYSKSNIIHPIQVMPFEKLL
jgi:hypothetical protein